MKIRKAAIFSALIFSVCLTGCTAATLTAGAPDPGICGGYETDFTAQVNIVMPDNSGETEFSFGGHIRRLGSGFWDMELTSPETVTGLEISAADDVLTSQLGDLTFDVSADKLPGSSPVTAIFLALDNAAADTVSGKQLQKGDDGWVLNGESYAVIFDDEGYPVAMSVSQPGINVEFSGFNTEAPDGSVTEGTEQ